MNLDIQDSTDSKMSRNVNSVSDHTAGSSAGSITSDGVTQIREKNKPTRLEWNGGFICL